MALSNSKLLQTLSFIALFLMLANKVHSDDVTSFTFDSFSSNENDLTYQGGAHVPSNSRFLRLTETDASGRPRSWSVGRVLFNQQVHFWQRSPMRQSTFECTMRFIITPSANGAADGLAFFIAPVDSRIPTGSAGANLGIFDSSGNAANLFAVEFDTYPNGFDPNYRHIGIDINSRVSRNTTRFNSATGEVVTARINYNSNTRMITVRATCGSRSAFLSYQFDLKTVLPEMVQVGISSATGQHVSSLGVHDLLSWYFTSTLVYDNPTVEKEEAYIRQCV